MHHARRLRTQGPDVVTKIRVCLALAVAALLLAHARPAAAGGGGTILQFFDKEINNTPYDTSDDNDPTTLTILSGTATQSGAITGSGLLIKTGDGTIILSGISTYSGDTVVDAGTLQFTHGGVLTATNRVVVGDAGGSTGTVLLSGGNVNAVSATLGAAPGATGTVTVLSGNWYTSNDTTLGDGGTGVLNLGHAAASMGSLYLGVAGGTGTVNVSGDGSLTSTDGTYVGYDGTGVLKLTDHGVMTVGLGGGQGILQLGYNPGSTGTLYIGTGGMAGTLQAGLVSGGDGTATVIFNHTGDLNFTPSMGGSLSVVLSGPGTTTLSTQNSYSGATQLLGGTLELRLDVGGTDIISSASALQLGGGTLRLVGAASQTFAGFSTLGGAGSVVLGASEQVVLGTPGTFTPGSAVNFNTAAGGADGGSAGSGTLVLTGQSQGSPINADFTVTDSTGFGLATVDAADQIVRLTTQALLPAVSAGSGDYLIDNNAGGSSAAGSSTLVLTASESLSSLTVDTTPAAGVLTLAPGVLLANDVWNFGSSGSGGHSYEIASGGGVGGITSATAGGTLRINNYNSAPVTLDTPIWANDGTTLEFAGPGTTLLTTYSYFTGSTFILSGTLGLLDTADFETNGNLMIGNMPGNAAGLVIHGGTLSDAYAYIANGPDSSASATITSGQWMNSGDLYVGLGGAAVLNISGGNVSNQDSVFGYFATSSGVANVSGGTWSTGGNLMVGYFGAGVLNLSGGTLYSTASQLGYYAGSTGTVNMSGGTWQMIGDLRIGLDGTGVLNLSGGSVSSTFGYLGLNAGGSGTLNVSGGQMTMQYDLTAGVYGGSGVVNLTDAGVLNLGATGDRTLYLAFDDGSHGTLNIGTGGTAGTLNAAVIAGGGGESVVNFNHTDDITFGAAMTGPLSVNFYGPGTTTLTAASTYTGVTAPLGGTLVLQFSPATTADILPATTDLALGSAILRLSGDGTQSLNSLGVRSYSAASIVLGENETLSTSDLRGMRRFAALNIDTSAGGASGATVGTGVMTLAGQPVGQSLQFAVTVTDATGFGLAAANDSGQVYRLTAMNMDLLPAEGASTNGDYFIDTTAAQVTQVTASESMRSLTVDTTGGESMLLLGADVTLGADVWNFGGAGIGDAHSFSIAGGALTSLSPGGVLQINNYNRQFLVIESPFLDNDGMTLLFQGPGITLLEGASTGLKDVMVTSGVLAVAYGGSYSYTGTTTVGSQIGDNAIFFILQGTVTGADGVIGDAAGALGTVALAAGGTWTQPNGDLFVGRSGSGLVDIMDGGTVQTQNSFLGQYAGSSGTVNLESGGTWYMNRGLHIGGEGAGVVNFTGGALTVGGERENGTITLGAQGVLNMGNGLGIGTLLAGKVTGSNGAQLNFNFSARDLPELQFSPVLTGGLALSKTGGGQLTLATQESYTGATTVNAGTLYLYFFSGRIAEDLLSSSSALTLGGGTLSLVAQRGGSTQTLNGLTTTAGTGSKIWLGSKMTLNLGALTSAGTGSALNFDTSAGNADGATVGTSIITLTGQTPGAAINPGFTVTDATGFGLATVNAQNQIVRITDTPLLSPAGSDAGTDYRIDNNAGSSLEPGSATLEIPFSQTARSITVDTTSSSGVLTLDPGATVSTDVWNFGGAYGGGYEITGDGGLSTATAGGMLQINNYNFSQVTLSTPILDYEGSGLRVAGTGALLLNGVGSYTGETVVNSGMLFINGDFSAATGQVTVQSGATLGGTGTLGGAIHVENGGMLTPGDTQGLGALTGTTATFDENSIFHVLVGGSAMNTLHLTGSVTIDPGAVLYIDTYDTLTASSYTLITADGGFGGMSSFTLGGGTTVPDGYHLVYTGTTLELDLLPSSAPAAAWWTGAQGANWSTLNSGATNWATAADGLTDTGALPDSPTDVTFSASGLGLQQTVLDACFTLNSLTIDSDTTISATDPATLSVNNATTVNALLGLESGVTLNGGGALTISSTGTLAGSGSVQMAADQNIIVNGAVSVGDPGALVPAAQVLTLSTSGTGAVVMGAGSELMVSLYSGAGLGDNTATSAAADQLSLHGTLDATAGGTLVISNPNHMSAYAGGDQWKLVELNTSACTPGSISGSLAVNDTALGLATGFTGSFDAATGVYSIADHRPEMTAQTSGLPMSDAQHQSIISGGQTATNDVNNHLFNLRSGGGEEGGGDGSIASSLDEGVVMGQGDGPEDPIARRVKRTRQWEVFTTVNYGNVRLNPISNQSGVQIDSWASSIGIERHLSRGVTLGFAATFLQSHQAYTGGAGHLNLEGPSLSAYLAYVKKSFWASLLYSFGDYDLSSSRNPGLGLPVASGDTTSYVNSVQFNTGWNFRFQNRTLVTGPFVGIDYLHGSVDAYNETGGGAGALHYDRQSFESLVTRVGWSLSKKFETEWADITPQIRVSYERQNLKNNGTSVSLINAPFSASGGNQSPGQDYMVLGGGVNFQFSPAFNLMLGYQLQLFRNNMTAQFGSIRFGYRF
ncbi:autotransporter-associated beta strand repeat-containing protein [Prosthecobacter sp.]|uniref:autotransporter-associated beta strand repeat-containing protein n=1 Tax=Prosthecobacter sp. TaxID=1965333 RepID=UPI003783359F